MFPFSPLSPFRFVSCVYFQCVCSLEVMQKAVRALGERCGGRSDAAVLSWLCSKQGDSISAGSQVTLIVLTSPSCGTAWSCSCIQHPCLFCPISQTAALVL